jgi:hypothetical protein
MFCAGARGAKHFGWVVIYQGLAEYRRAPGNSTPTLRVADLAPPTRNKIEMEWSTGFSSGQPHRLGLNTIGSDAVLPGEPSHEIGDLVRSLAVGHVTAPGEDVQFRRPADVPANELR